jgi:putative selenate reductase
MKTKGVIAVIGSGPAGLAVAKALVGKFEVIVFDELQKFGGMLAYGIPEFRLAGKLVENQISNAKESGIKFEQEKITHIKKLLKENGGKFDKVVLAIGAGAGRKLGLEGKDLCLDGLELLKQTKLENKNDVRKEDVVGVIGGGNSAIDIARTAKRSCNKSVIIYRRTEKEMPSHGNEMIDAKKERIEFEFLVQPMRFEKQGGQIKVICEIMRLGETDASGRRRPIGTGDKKEFLFDKVFFAVGQQQDEAWLCENGFELEKGFVKVNDRFETSISNIFAVGDIVTGPKSIGEAMVNGKKLGEQIINERTE